MRRLAPIVLGLLFAAVCHGQLPVTDAVSPTSPPADPTAADLVGGTSFLAECDSAAPPCGPRFWAHGEFVFWAIGDSKLVDLGLNAINSDALNALLSLTGKSYLDVARRLLGDDRTGYRFGLGAWLDDGQTLGAEADFLRVRRAPLTFQLGRNIDLNPLARAIPDGDIVLQRAGFLPDRTTPDDRRRLAALVLILRGNPILRALFLLSRLELPGIEPGGRTVVIPYGSRNLVNGSALFEVADVSLSALDLLGRVRLVGGDGVTVDGLFGYRRVSYSDGLRIYSTATTLARPLLPGTTVRSLDAIGTGNTYDGLLLGADVGWRSGNWDLSVRATATPAELRADVNRLGAQTVTFPDTRPRLTVAGGTYLRSSDGGAYSDSGWTVISEVGLRATRTFGEHFALTLGTSLMYIPDAAVAYPQLPLGTDPDRGLPGRTGTAAARPLPPALTAIFLSTISAGLEFRY